MRLHLGDDIREIDFALGSIVYHRCRDDPMRGMVTGIGVTPGDVHYWVTWGCDGREMKHYAMELTTEYQPNFGPTPPGRRPATGPLDA